MKTLKQIEEEFGKRIWCEQPKCPTCSSSRKLLRDSINQIIDEMIGEKEKQKSVDKDSDDMDDMFQNAETNGYNQKVQELKEYKKNFNKEV